MHFSDGTSASRTLLVGADGGRSRIRRQHVLHHKVIDPEAVCLYGRMHLTPELLRGLAILRDVVPVIQQIIFNSVLPVSMFVERIHFPHRGEPGHEDLPEDYMY
ncbi:hypothetical protein MMYC01_200485 [Madurella mycetomatis]|uniref:Uncharacterized protein n=1 Tax=Madurella mycetomatis TaxID=100816 RepID=A0A175WHP5_9PEZI|nr:hypothetical protein MMYC01_200485 [Madurella mycetomatis]